MKIKKELINQLKKKIIYKLKQNKLKEKIQN